MLTRRTLLGVCASLAWADGALRLLAADEPKAEPKAKPKKKSGTVIGEVTAKGKAWVEVKADGEAKARRYVPHWVGGAPKDGGGPDKAIVRAIDKLTIGSRVLLEWEFEERPRVVKVETLRAPAKGR